MLTYEKNAHKSAFKNFLAVVKFYFRRVFYAKNVKRLNEICFGKNEKISQYFTIHQPNDLIHIKYASNAFNYERGYDYFEKTIEILDKNFSDIFEKNEIKLYENNGACVFLRLSPKMINESICTISLSFDGIDIFDISVVFMDDEVFKKKNNKKNNGILITCIQGRKGQKDEIRDFTKQFFGLRPMAFLIYFVFVFAKQLKFGEIFGVADKFAISSFKRGKKRAGRVLDFAVLDDIYAQICECEYNAKNGWYKLDYKLKPIEEVPSKKRSMYKKRYEMLGQIQEKIVKIGKK